MIAGFLNHQHIYLASKDSPRYVTCRTPQGPGIGRRISMFFFGCLVMSTGQLLRANEQAGSLWINLSSHQALLITPPKFHIWKMMVGRQDFSLKMVNFSGSLKLRWGMIIVDQEIYWSFYFWMFFGSEMSKAAHQDDWFCYCISKWSKWGFLEGRALFL